MRQDNHAAQLQKAPHLRSLLIVGDEEDGVIGDRELKHPCQVGLILRQILEVLLGYAIGIRCEPSVRLLRYFHALLANPGDEVFDLLKIRKRPFVDDPVRTLPQEPALRACAELWSLRSDDLRGHRVDQDGRELQEQLGILRAGIAEIVDPEIEWTIVSVQKVELGRLVDIRIRGDRARRFRIRLEERRNFLPPPVVAMQQHHQHRESNVRWDGVAARGIRQPPSRTLRGVSPSPSAVAERH